MQEIPVHRFQATYSFTEQNARDARRTSHVTDQFVDNTNESPADENQQREIQKTADLFVMLSLALGE